MTLNYIRVADACLNFAGNVSSEKERSARCAMMSEKTDCQRIMRDARIMSIMDDIGGEEASCEHLTHLVTVTGDSVLSTDPS